MRLLLWCKIRGRVNQIVFVVVVDHWSRAELSHPTFFNVDSVLSCTIKIPANKRSANPTNERHSDIATITGVAKTAGFDLSKKHAASDEHVF